MRYLAILLFVASAAAQQVSSGVHISPAPTSGPAGPAAKDLPVAVAQGIGVSLGCSSPLISGVLQQPDPVLIAGTATTAQRGVAGFKTGVICDWSWMLPSSFTSITSVEVEAYNDTDSTSGHTIVFNFQYSCGGALSAAQPITVTLSGTAPSFHHQSITPTISGCAANNLMDIRLTLGASTATGVNGLIALRLGYQ